jgi:mevalonate kinase
MAAIGIGHAKLILFGEHAAVYGHPALGVALPERTRVEISRGGETQWTFPGCASHDAALLGRIVGCVGGPRGCGRLSLSTDVPRGLGFGSSAALCVAVTAALREAVVPYGREVWEPAHRAEALFHGRPSGVDTGLALLRGFRSFRPQPPALPRERHLPEIPLALVVGATPRAGSTGDHVEALGRRLADSDPVARAAIDGLGALAQEAEAAFLHGGPGSAGELGVLADRAHRLLCSVGLGSAAQDRLLAAGRRLGCLGGKMSGAGGGGAFYLIAPDAQTAAAAAGELRETAARMSLPEAAWIRAVIFPG